jgi:GNAT superfamily N-acetyltransferase
MIPLTIREVDSRQDWRDFAQVKEKIYSRPICPEEDIWEETRNLRVLSQGDPYRQIAAFIALHGDEVIGRIAAITDSRHQSVQEGFFGFFECIEDQQAARQLLMAAAEKLKSWGKSVMLGPISPSTNDKVGIMVEGFDTLPHQNLTYNPPYYQELLEQCGLTKAMGLLSYLWRHDMPIPSHFFTLEARAMERYDAAIVFQAKGDLRQETEILTEVYNESLKNNWGFVPLTTEEARGILRQYRFSPHPELLFRLDVAGEPAGICLLQPNTRPGLKPTDPQIRAAVLGLKPRYRNKGLSTLLIIKAIQIVKEQGCPTAEISLIMENNRTVRGLIEKTLQCPVLHRYQVYRTELST